ncbi:MAG TPA: hypothetical protein DHV62_09645 [Elusimicrobia bacterium]|nr:hypothetical protein [Elusimicrobiota bacterium]
MRGVYRKDTGDENMEQCNCQERCGECKNFKCSGKQKDERLLALIKKDKKRLTESYGGRFQ